MRQLLENGAYATDPWTAKVWRDRRGVHMLSNLGAFNAMLKTLEEPP